MAKATQGIWVTYRRLLAVARKYWVSFAIGVLATVVLSLTDAGFAYLVEPIVNKGFIHRTHAFIHGLPILIVLIFLVRAVAGFSSSYFIASVARSVVRDFRVLLFNKLMQLPAKFYDKNPSGKLLSTVIYNVEQVAQASSNALITVLRETSLVLGLLAVMFVLDWRLASLFLFMAPLISIGFKVCNRRLRRLSNHVQSSVAQVSHVVNETLTGYKMIRLFGGQTYEQRKFNEITRDTRHQELKVEVTNGIGSSIIQLLVSVPLAMVLFVATLPKLSVSAGSFAAIVSAMIMLIRPVRRITTLNTVIQRGLAGAASIFDLLDEPEEKDAGNIAVSRIKGDIVYRNVSFQYDSANYRALSDINFSIDSGQTVAIIGASGSGKSTLVSLLPRFYELFQGDILIDGVSINQYRLRDLRSQFSLVSQHTVLFNDTVAHNIAYAEQGQPDRERVIQAAKLANADEFIENLPQGFDTVIGERGLLLSGGQQQRIAIARALYKQAPIVILDEATSALDTQSERLIQSALANLMHECTTLVIAHRLSTIENADRIIVIDQGRLVESGQHQELLARGGIYRELYQLQFHEKN